MTQIHRFRTAVAKHLGRKLTPETAASIELEAFTVPDESIDPAQFEPQEWDGLVFAAESFRAIVEELHPLHEVHYAETERARGGQALDPDYDQIAALERCGKLLQFTAREGGALVGNLRMYLFHDLHTGTLGAREDALFLAQPARRGLRASRFVRYGEQCLAQVGVADVWCDTKILFDDAGNVIRDVGVLLKRQGYAHVANKFHKRLAPLGQPVPNL